MIHSAGRRWCNNPEHATPDDRWHQDSVDCIACLRAVVKTGEACAERIAELQAQKPTMLSARRMGDPFRESPGAFVLSTGRTSYNVCAPANPPRTVEDVERAREKYKADFPEHQEYAAQMAKLVEDDDEPEPVCDCTQRKCKGHRGGPCQGNCGCARCHRDYQDFLSGE